MANSIVRRSAWNAASSVSRERKARNPPNTSPPAERIGPASPMRCSPCTCAAIRVPIVSASESTRRVPTSASTSSAAGRVPPTTTGRGTLSLDTAKNTTSEFVACLIVCARESFNAYAATNTPCGAAPRDASGVATAM